ncbi:MULTISPECIES: hypothetical protein [Prochlorococcus]|uniref:Membrane protein n=1 Tax=Prochlorococcus marinus (strain SARG / CCMP1375 / SS120) TaxID=167539 RepID=Q7V9P8_PROMA|nr:MULTISPECIES: hypothetical protein [Prochlorococcus]AAQ00825.1 Membrane protein [Prochlorococcus marinus subsp. marinus str. CCMP1375]KGG10679.1 Rod shape-determining protein MreD [Prochlorococcus marinus str. LG]KGG21100.1 Rod shape-determining protein MreD [Prochlorococcus marinus str. SS2]KGG23925.1 Rod shape-determining protein MreD [Prochlorococcus marinus str. SS35]KGG31815.1 Rod shape-determining protein MreD [Prochlorococcus marinus str. SS51]
MRKEQKKTIYKFLVLLVPLLILSSPSWLMLGGVGARWAQLWLLPWALIEGPLAGLFAGFCLGTILDTINLDGSSQIPALMLLGFWWGRLGTKSQYFDKTFTLGLLAWIGSIISDVSIWAQKIFFVDGNFLIFNAWSFYTLLAGSIVTGLIAPLLCSFTMRTFFRGKI